MTLFALLSIVNVYHKGEVTRSAYSLLFIGEAWLSLSFILIFTHLDSQLLTVHSSIESYLTTNKVMHTTIALDGNQSQLVDRWSINPLGWALPVSGTLLILCIQTVLQFIRCFWSIRLIHTPVLFRLSRLWAHNLVLMVSLNRLDPCTMIKFGKLAKPNIPWCTCLCTVCWVLTLVESKYSQRITIRKKGI